MTLTAEQRALIEPAIRRSWKSWVIARDFGLSLEDVVAWRAERTRVVKARRANARDKRLRAADRDMTPLAGGADPSTVDDGRLLAELAECPLYEDVTPDDIALEDYAWSIRAHVPGEKGRRLIRDARAAA